MGYIITLTGEYGAGSRLIGKMVSESLNIKLYDKNLLNLTAEKSGLTVNYVNEMTEQRPFSIMYSLYLSSIPASDRVFTAMSQVVSDIAKSEDAVIVGACADYFLSNKQDCLRVFVTAPSDVKVARARDEYGTVGKSRDPRGELAKLERARIAYHDYFTQNKWGQAADYDLCVNSRAGLAETAGIIAFAARAGMVVK